MQERICPACGQPCYSAAMEEEVWLCPRCGAEIPLLEEEAKRRVAGRRKGT